MHGDTDLSEMCVAPGVRVRVHVFPHLPSFPEAILNYVSVRSLSPLYFLHCAAPLYSVSNSPHAGTLCIPPALRSLSRHTILEACGQCWIHASIRFLRLLPQEKKIGGKKTRRHLHGPWTHNQSKNLKLLGSNAFSAPSQLKKVLCYAKATKKRKCIFFPMYLSSGLFKKKSFSYGGKKGQIVL